MTQANMWLGRSEYPDNDANATYSEVRIFDTAFAPSQVAALNAAGPSATLGVGPILPTATAVTIAPNATLDLDGGSQQIASLNDAAPGMGGSVINSNTSSAVTLTLSPTGGIAKFSGSIEDSGAPGSITLVLDGPGTQILSGSNTYSGGTVVTEGTLILASPSALADGSSLTVGQGASSLFAPAFAPSSVSASPAIAATVPEPGTLLLLLAALGCAAACRRAGRRGNQTQ
jgi:autotransporter-associated beta strand protein